MSKEGVMTKAKEESTVLAGPNDQKSWDLAVKLHKDGYGDIQAIQEVYDAMPPPARLSTLAVIIGAIYADSYWGGTKMDYRLLSASLQKGGGWSKSECDRAAQEAFANWYGLLARNDFQDVGHIPKARVLTNSPDALCNMDGPLIRSRMLTQWNSYFFNQAVVGKNYCYARAQSVNIPVEIKEAKARMFYTDAGFTPPPTSWQIFYTEDKDIFSALAANDKPKPEPILPGGRAASGAFIFEPPQAHHYCLLAVSSTEFFKNDPLSAIGNWNSLEWITYNGAAAWHNIDVPATETVLKFYNQDDRAERFAFDVHCERVPVGTTIALECQDGRLVRDLMTEPVKVTSRVQRLSSGDFLVPANFAGDLTVRIETPDGKPLPAEASIELRQMWLLDYGHRHYGQAIEHLNAYRAGAAAQTLEVQLGNYYFVGSDS